MNSESQATTPDIHQFRQNINFKHINRFRVAVENIHEQDCQIDMNDPSIHELLAAFTIILNNGIDQGLQKYPTSPSQEESKGFLSIFQTIIVGRKSTKFLNKLNFLKNDKMKMPVWILLEISTTTIMELIQNPDFQSKYSPNSIFKSNFVEISECLDLFYSKKLIIIGDLLKKYDKFIDITISILCPSDEEKSLAPSHKKQDQDTPDVLFRANTPQSPLQNIILLQESDEVIEDEEETHNINFISVKFKRSSILLKQEFEQYLENYKYQILLHKPQQNAQYKNCHQCNCQIDKYFWRPNTAIYCNFSGEYFCLNCISHIKQIIPYKVANDFDLNQYTVSKSAYTQIFDSFSVPFIQIHSFQDIVFSQPKLYEFLILKRTLHLMYDKLCSNFEFQHLDQNVNLLLTINILSLNDFLEIRSGKLYSLALQAYKEGLQHINTCSQCKILQQKCKQCNLGKIYFFDIKETQYCQKCKALYHRACFKDQCISCSRIFMDHQQQLQ